MHRSKEYKEKKAMRRKYIIPSFMRHLFSLSFPPHRQPLLFQSVHSASQFLLHIFAYKQATLFSMVASWLKHVNSSIE